MPNCDYYGTIDDHGDILEFLFSENLCDIFELYSEVERPLKKFNSPEEVLSQFSRCYTTGKKWHTVYLQLYVKGAGPDFKPTLKELVPEKNDGATFKYRAEGWGLIQLYLSTTVDKILRDSHSNHNTEKRANKWSSICSELEDPSLWDFSKITKFSSRLNRQIRKKKVAKLNSRVVLPGGLKAWDEGCTLAPYHPDKHEIERL